MHKDKITPTKKGWYWYRFCANNQYTPVYCDVDFRGEWFISESPVREEQFVKYLDDLPGAIVQWIGEAPSADDQN